MPSLHEKRTFESAKLLTVAANASFVPIGVVTVLLSPLLPTLSARWSLNYSQAGALFTAQFLASTIAVSLSGILIASRGFRFAMNAGLLVIAISIAMLLAGSRLLGICCIAGYGAGLGLAVPAANLLVADVNPGNRSSSLNVLNFSWSAGAVACPFLVGVFAKSNHIPQLLYAVAAFSLLVVAGICVMPSTLVEPSVTKANGTSRKTTAGSYRALFALCALFFVYVGTENSFGGWLASYASSLHSMSYETAVMTPAFFYSALMTGRLVAPLVLRSIDDLRLAKTGLILACAGMAGLMRAHGLAGVAVSASAAGMGLSSVYPITISLLSRVFSSSATRIGSLMFTVANIGGACLPWLVGVSSTHFGEIRAGLAIPLLGSAVMYFLYLPDWQTR